MTRARRRAEQERLAGVVIICGLARIEREGIDLSRPWSVAAAQPLDARPVPKPRAVHHVRLPEASEAQLRALAAHYQLPVEELLLLAFEKGVSVMNGGKR